MLQLPLNRAKHVTEHAMDVREGANLMALDPLPWQTPPSGGPMSEAEYFELDEQTFNGKYEYLNGVARLMSGGSGEHDEIAFNIRVALKARSRCRVAGSDLKVMVGRKANGRPDYVYPDVTVSCDMCDRRRGIKMIRSPRIVIEVLSPSTEKFDRTDKRGAYQAYPTIREIVLVSQFAPYVEVYRREEENSSQWSHVYYSAGEEMLLASVDARIPIDEIYQGIDFDELLLDELLPDE